MEKGVIKMAICESCGDHLDVVQMVTVEVLEAREVTGFNESGHPEYGEIEIEESCDTEYDRTYQCRSCGCEITKEQAMEAVK
jgi:hypothetical protein